MIVEKALFEDVKDILRLYRLGVKEIGDDFEESYAVNKILTSIDLAPCFLLKKNGNVIGMAGLTLAQISHNGKAILCDYMVYVEPKHRSIKSLGLLIEECKRFANSVNLPLRFDFLCNNDEKLRRRMFAIFGFKVASLVGIYGK